MEQQYPESAVVFRNVGQLYFPQTRVECHYSMTSAHQWSSRDWIGIFKVGWSSLREYHTYSWSLVPEGYAEGTAVDCCALFQAFYLPRPSTEEYQFVYVDKVGGVCARSRPFTFCSPKPLEELETLKEECDEEDGDEEELLLVVPKAQLLQSQLEESWREKEELQQAVEEAKQQIEEERRNSRKVKEEWESEREAMKEQISELLENLNHKCDALKTVEGKHLDVTSSQQNLNTELNQLLEEKVQSQQRIKDLEEDIKALADREEERNTEMERLKEILKKACNQIKLDEEKKTLLKAAHDAALAEVRGLQLRLESSERLAESLRRELRELGTRQGHAHAELHQAHLQVAQLGLQLSEEKLLLREERTNWALEREASRQAAEADQKKLEELSSEVCRKEEQLREERMKMDKLEAGFGMRDHDADGDAHLCARRPGDTHDQAVHHVS
ncbi:calcium-binding and coiled-coil domain-containing protein 1b isoform X3 [Dunckerocampus dactyliophorus]|uniref:calcium-binding and coiled-coil domain-containing protein 1b isoform X3 n=1 Tax=Dunckerocampus dactyliophorus TaxID=161453 RepID=UPI0024058541|nr:calcium-binding and coiled-coil domain-containing protein 1b isoform X3 [Dunckerocampus dactyliophorus]